MGEEDRGGLPNPDPDLSKNWGGLPDPNPDLSKNRGSLPDLDLNSPRQISMKSQDKSKPNLDSPRLLAKSRGESRLVSTFLELPRKF